MYHKIPTIVSVMLLACAIAPAIAAPVRAPAIPDTATSVMNGIPVNTQQSGARAVGETSGQEARDVDGRALPGIPGLSALGNLIPGFGAGGGLGAGGLGAGGLGAGGGLSGLLGFLGSLKGGAASAATAAPAAAAVPAAAAAVSPAAAGALAAAGLPGTLTPKRADIASLLMELSRREISEHEVRALHSALGVGTGVAAAQSLAAEIKKMLGGRDLSVMNELD